MIYLSEGWEYTIVDGHEDVRIQANQLNHEGEHGWELVSVISTKKGVLFYFKRPRPLAPVEEVEVKMWKPQA